MTEPDAVSDDLDLLLDALPPALTGGLVRSPRRSQLLEIVLDLGRRPEARFADGVEDLAETAVERQDLAWVLERVGRFGPDNRAGIARTLHRISALRNRQGEVVGLTCRVGRAVAGTIDVVRDTIEAGASVLLLGRPGVGKTTLLREAARVMADDLGRRVIVVDTSNEIAGDGDIPHPGIGRARRMQVPAPAEQHAVMIEAVENHMPEVIVIDEIGTAAEALAARTIAERGVQLVATAHGNTLENLLQNPTLSDLVGGIQSVVLSDEEARRRGTQKTVLERRAPPTFDVVVEIQDQTHFVIHRPLAEVVDRRLRGYPTAVELRVRTQDGVEGRVDVQRPLPFGPFDPRTGDGPGAVPDLAGGADRPRRASRDRGRERSRDRDPWDRAPASPRAPAPPGPPGRALRVFPYAVSRSKVERAARDLRLPIQLARRVDEADLVLALKSHEKRQPPRLREAARQGVAFLVVKSNTLAQVENALRGHFGLATRRGAEDDADADARAFLPPPGLLSAERAWDAPVAAYGEGGRPPVRS